jgi:hypothetical protein
MAGLIHNYMLLVLGLFLVQACSVPPATISGRSGASTYDGVSPVTPVIADSTKVFNSSFTTAVSQGVPADVNFKEFRYTTDGSDPTCESGTSSFDQPTYLAILAAG